MRTLSLCLGLLFAVSIQAADPAVLEPTEKVPSHSLLLLRLYICCKRTAPLICKPYWNVRKRWVMRKK